MKTLWEWTRPGGGGLARSLAVAWLVLAMVLFAACDRKSAETPAATPTTGFVAGQAMLADGAKGGHAGITVFLGGTSYSARTDENGNYTISGVPTGSYSVLAEKSGYQNLTVGKAEVNAAVHTSGSPLTLQTAILEKDGSGLTTGSQTATAALGTIRGSVVVIGAKSGEDVRVLINGSERVTVTDEAGNYAFFNVDPGNYNLSLSKSGYAPQITNVTVKSGEVGKPAEVTMRPEQASAPKPERELVVTTQSIEQAKLNGNRTIKGFVQLQDEEGNRVTDYSDVLVAIDNSDYAVTPDENGQFKFENLPPAVYAVLATLTGGQPKTEPVDVTEKDATDVRFNLGGPKKDEGGTPGSVVGRIVMEPMVEGGQAPDGSGVTVGLAGIQAVAFTAKDGKFKLENIPEGEYAFFATKDEYEPLRQEGVNVSPGNTVDLGDITLEPKRDYPRVVATSPAEGEKNVMVGYDLAIQVKFSKQMDINSVRQAVTLEPAAAWQSFMGKGSHPLADDDNLVLVLSNSDERRPIRYNQGYRVSIAKSARDTGGITMKKDFSFVFSTGAPGIIGTVPQNGERGAFGVGGAGNTLLVKFNTRIKPDSVTASSVRIRPYTGISPTVTVSDEPGTGWSTMAITVQLMDNQDYTVTVNRSVRTYNGQPIANTPYTFRFRTDRNAPPTQPPLITR
ncbi:MAG: carboxypeptidase regulatory-like domain-containing protein [Candidatus Sumerlaeaceae bacterium]|nr:carboxypeptidase regulatory-like domain-containing protein [Candidatus Sumerlaeaceae bacterium]